MTTIPKKVNGELLENLKKKFETGEYFCVDVAEFILDNVKLKHNPKISKVFFAESAAKDLLILEGKVDEIANNKLISNNRGIDYNENSIEIFVNTERFNLANVSAVKITMQLFSQDFHLTKLYYVSQVYHPQN